MKERLYRSRIDRVFGGVASGLSQYLHLDPILVRVIFIILAFINGIGLLLYIIMWIVVPEDPNYYGFGPIPNSSKPENNPETEQKSSDSGNPSSTYAPPFPQKKNGSSGRIIVGVIFIGMGFVFFADRIFPYFDFEDFFPLLLIIVGIALLWNSLKK